MGNGVALSGSAQKTPVHPHAYGERDSISSSALCSGGSSPRIWGTACIGVPACTNQRFIPTHMGNGVTGQGYTGAVPVHPHAYGERRSLKDQGQVECGSSPRIWGTVKCQNACADIRRFIPTHMGNGERSISHPPILAVHPHAYGERGTGSDNGRALMRFIPTHMGNGRCARPPISSPPVHPHAYGERCRCFAPFDRQGGSSPRIWGTE